MVTSCLSYWNDYDGGNQGIVFCNVLFIIIIIIIIVYVWVLGCASIQGQCIAKGSRIERTVFMFEQCKIWNCVGSFRSGSVLHGDCEKLLFGKDAVWSSYCIQSTDTEKTGGYGDGNTTWFECLFGSGKDEG